MTRNELDTMNDRRRARMVRELQSHLAGMVEAGDLTAEQANQWTNDKADQWAGDYE